MAQLTVTVSDVGVKTGKLTLNNAGIQRIRSYQSHSIPYQACNRLSPGDTEVSWDDLKPNTNYHFTLYYGTACSASQKLITAPRFKTLPRKPDTPTVTTNVGSGKLIIASSVSEVSGNPALDKWQYIKKAGTADWESDDDWTDIAVTSTTLSYTVTGLDNGIDYQFKVRAVNSKTSPEDFGGGTGAESNASDPVQPVASSLSARSDPPTFGNQRIPDQSSLQNTPIEALTLPAATGGDGNLSYALAPDLPVGLTFDPVTRALAGTPTKPQGMTTYTYTVTDSVGQEAQLTFTLMVEADLLPTFGDQTIRARTYVQDQAIAVLTLPQATSGNPPLTYALAPELPAGLTFDPGTRTLAGTPAEPRNATRYTYTATDVDGDQATLTFTITVMLSVAEKKRLEDGLAAQGRALLSGATGVIGERFRNPGPSLRDGTGACAGEVPEPDETRGKPGEGSQPADCTTGLLNTVAQAVLAMSGTGGSADETRPRAIDVGTQPAWNWESLVWGRSFALPLKKPGSPESADWTLWGAGDIQGFQGTPREGKYDGQVRSLYLGVDMQWQESWLAGAALARSWGETDYATGAGGSEGQLETTLTSVYPYVRGAFESGLEVWALGGYGRGEAELSRPDQAGADTSDLSLAMGATGVRQPMTEFGGAQWAVVGGAGYLSLATEGGDSLVSDLDVAVQRVRLAVEATWAVGGLAPYVQVGGRYDGGDGQTGAGLETVAGLRYTSDRLEFEARGRWLAAHAADGYEEYGGLARLAVKPRADGTGWQMDVAPRWGAAQGAGLLGGGAALLDGGAMPGAGMGGVQPAGTRALSMASELGYGFAVFDGQGVLTPYGGFALTGEATRQYRLGGRLGVAEWLTVSLEGIRREAARQQPANQGVQLQLEGRF